ncbi:MAG: DegT/DnrJ/EryC1/StrS family aminotransferase [bacterium]
MYKSGLLIGTFRKQEYKGEETEDSNKKMSDFQIKFLIKKLNKWEEEEKHRIWVAKKYEEFLKETFIQRPRLSATYQPTYLRYPILVKNKDKVLEEAQKRKIELGDWYISPVHPLIDEQLELVNYKKGLCPIAEEVCQKVVTLPIHEKITEKEIERIKAFLYEMEVKGFC